jgi:peptidyl-prolyl cis-trans isomerase C
LTVADQDSTDKSVFLYFLNLNAESQHTQRRGMMARASARHILVETKEACEQIKAKIAAGADFAAMAKEHSLCPSGAEGGNLGEFGPGQMVREFDTVVFSGEVGKVHGPIQTQFGYHLVEITSRTA